MLDILKDFNERSRPKTAEGKNEKINTYNCEYGLYEGWELVLNAFRSEIFPITTQGKDWENYLIEKGFKDYH